MHRLVTLAKIVDTLGPIKGEKSLQKLIYLIDSRSSCLGYRFSYDRYGPVSFQLQKDIKELDALGLISIGHEDNIPIYHQAKQPLSRFWREKLNEVRVEGRMTDIISSIENLGDQGKDPLFLEVMASIDYLAQGSSPDPVSELVSSGHGRYTPDFVKSTHDHWKRLG